ncbi:cyclic AMP-responsive element-binding protein 3-like protein 4 isoform X2 [Meles meles]|uniref:cyclic AMP-responsive element-binding protein 3-like protein 4 isoform X2 n=1 Tax=Meles meles TaxID=9662 RepID=UPI001E6A0E00|nr:cyclic AMP-responsive element-binding protein 3-like protein 4 isoform X2 [Meles meles]
MRCRRRNRGREGGRPVPSCSPARGRLRAQPPPRLPARDSPRRTPGVSPGAGRGWAGPGCEILEGGGAAVPRAARGLGRLGGGGRDRLKQREGGRRGPPGRRGRMDFRNPDLPDAWLAPPEDVSAGAFLELGLPCPAPEVPGTKLRERGPAGCEPGGRRGCGLRESEPEDCLQLFVDPNEVYRSEAARGGDSAVCEDPGPAARSPALCEVVYEAGGLERRPGEAGPAVGLVSLQLGPRSPPRTVPAACTVGELPLAAPTPPSVDAVNPAPLVSLSQSRTPGCKEMHPHPRAPGGPLAWSGACLKLPPSPHFVVACSLPQMGNSPDVQGAWPWVRGKGRRPPPPPPRIFSSPPAALSNVVPDRGGEASAGTGRGFPALSPAPHQGNLLPQRVSQTQPSGPNMASEEPGLPEQVGS